MKFSVLALVLMMGFTTGAKAELARFLYFDKDALQARTDIIQQAKKEISIEYFAVTDDDISIGAISLLCEASKRGVKVRVLMDALSNSVRKSTMVAAYKDCRDSDNKLNIEFRLFNPIDASQIQNSFHRDHDKMLEVDGKYMIVGGRNVDHKYFGLDKKRNFKDLDILISGKVVSEAQEYFNDLWKKTDVVKEPNLRDYDLERLKKGCDAADDHFTDHYTCQLALNQEIARRIKEIDTSSLRLKDIFDYMKSGKGEVKLFTNTDWLKGMKQVSGVKFLSNSARKNVSRNHHKISDELYSLFSKAKRKVLILSPYLIPNARAKNMFQTLINRGVSVTIITNSLKSTDNLFAQAGYKAAKQEMIEMGIELYEYNLVHTTHAKTAVIDDEIALIGTFNLDPRSSQINREIGIEINDQDQSGLATDLTNIINRFKSESLLVGRDHKVVNLRFQDAEVSTIKKSAVKVLEQAIPLIKDQL